MIGFNNHGHEILLQERNRFVANLKGVTDDLQTQVTERNTVMSIPVTNHTIAKFEDVTNLILTHQVLENI